MNVKEEKKFNRWHGSYKCTKLQLLAASPSGAQKLADVQSLNVLTTTLKQGLILQKSLRKRKAWVETIFSFSIFFNHLGILLPIMNF